MNTIGRRIKECRKAKGWTQEELATTAGLNLRTIQRIENGASRARGGTLALLCEALKLDFEEVSLLEMVPKKQNIGKQLLHYFFMGLLNFALMCVFWITTMHWASNANSRAAGVLLGLVIPVVIIGWTKEMSGLERVLKFGSGLILYLVFLFVFQGFLDGFAVGIRTLLIPCILMVLGILFYGDLFLRRPKTSS
ncbi:helix-turn-helix domain-containing protein [Spongiimicrobium salis]|uniref:helix-turn-helix domain-containing protein n=1 Tax=Spongiimicrobium salis TaxID=1667022 RepID=UPI00374D3CA0